MKEDLIRNPQAIQPFDKHFYLEGDNVTWSEKKYCALEKLYYNQEAAKNKDEIAYRVADNICMESRERGIYWGFTYMEPGDVSAECNMTRGYFYVDECNEYYMCFEGEGYLIFWDGEDDYFIEKMFQGSVHWVSTKYARRIVNIGDGPLAVAMCWGHHEKPDYSRIEKEGFPVRIFKRDGKIEIIEKEDLF